MDLRRFPDVEGPGLVAIDAADRLIVDEAAALLEDVAPSRAQTVVIDDAYGALTLSLLDVIGGDGEIRVGVMRHPAYLLRVIGMAPGYKEYFGARWFLRSLRENMPASKVREWPYGTAYTAITEPIVGGPAA